MTIAGLDVRLDLATAVPIHIIRYDGTHCVN